MNLVATLMTVVPFVFIHASRLVPYVGDPTNHIVVPYIAMFVVLFLLAGALYAEPRPLPARAWGENGWLFAALGGLGAGVVTAGLHWDELTNNVPPSPIASQAFKVRFRKTCWSWFLSTFTIGRFSDRSSTMTIFWKASRLPSSRKV